MGSLTLKPIRGDRQDLMPALVAAAGSSTPGTQECWMAAGVCRVHGEGEGGTDAPKVSSLVEVVDSAGRDGA